MILYRTISSTFLTLHLFLSTGSYKTGTSRLILLSVGDMVRAIMDVKPLRVQDLRLDYDNSQIYVAGTLLDRSPYEGEFKTSAFSADFYNYLFFLRKSII